MKPKRWCAGLLAALLLSLCACGVKKRAPKPQVTAGTTEYTDGINKSINGPYELSAQEPESRALDAEAALDNTDAPSDVAACTADHDFTNNAEYCKNGCGTVNPNCKSNEKLFSAGWMIVCITVLLLLAAGSGYVWLRRKQRRWNRSESKEICPTMHPSELPLTQNAAAIGKVHEQGTRENQQDSFSVSDEALQPEKPFLAVVADGMGGLSDGEKVSQIIVSAVMREFLSTKDGEAPQLANLLAKAKQAVDNLLGAGGLGRSGSTVVMGLLKDGLFDYISVGDSRISLYRNGELYQLNRSHTYAHDLLLDGINGQKTFTQIANDQKATCLTSYLGMGELRYVDIPDAPLKVRPGDKIILMSDGVFNVLNEQELSEALAQDVQAAAVGITRRIQEKNHPYQDNYTAVILPC